MRERLMQLLNPYLDGAVPDEVIRDIADHLLDNGVIVPPVKVGQTVWAVERYNRKPIAVIEGKVQMVGITTRSIKVLLRNHHDFNKTYVFGKTVFLTREAALKARENE